MTIIETTKTQFNVTGNFFQYGTDVISDKMPNSFEFRGGDGFIVKGSIHFLKDSKGRYVATFVIEKTHHIDEE